MTDSAGLFQPIEWDEALSVGVPEIDGEHQILLGLYNDAVRAFTAGCSLADKQKFVQDLDTYAFYHFSTEEALMRVCRYPRAKEHGGEHATFRRDLALLKAELEGGPEFEAHALSFIRTWIVRHISHSDKALGAFLAEASARWAGQRQNAAD